MGSISCAYLFTHFFRECHLMKWNEPLNIRSFLFSFCLLILFLLFRFDMEQLRLDLRLMSHLEFSNAFMIKIYINCAKLLSLHNKHRKRFFFVSFSVSMKKKLFWWLISYDSHSKNKIWLRHIYRMFSEARTRHMLRKLRKKRMENNYETSQRW